MNGANEVWETYASAWRAEGAEAKPGTPQAFGALIAREIPRWREVVRVGRIKPD